MNIRIFDLDFDDDFREKFHRGIDKILDQAYLSNHEYVEKFENTFARFMGASYATAVTSGTSSLEAAFRSIGCKNKKVIMPTNTFIATAVAAESAGAELVVLDIEDEFYGLCPEALENYLESHSTEEIACICAVHIGGHISDAFSQIMGLASKYKIPVIEDSAQALGATLDNKYAGTIGDYGCYSFFLTKVMTTGEGGMVVTNNSSADENLKSIRRFGMDLNNSIMHIRDGQNMKMTEIQALMGILELERVGTRIEKRRELASIYQNKLDPNKYKVVRDSSKSKGSYYKQIVVPLKASRDEISNALKAKNINLTGGVYYYPLHKQERYRNLINNSFNIADEFSSKHFCPPCYPELKNEEIEYICQVLNEL